VHDEDWQEGQVVTEPKTFVDAIRAAGLRADLFTFSQKLPDTQPRYDYKFMLQNLAVVRTDSFKDWWEQLPQVTRKNVRRAERRGVTVHVVSCDDRLIQGIADIYNEVPIRDGRPFLHFGKSFDVIKREVTTMPERSEFIGAYHGNKLIGFLKLVHMGSVSSILHIISKRSHYDKRPANALLAKAVEVCHERGGSYLV